MAAIGGRLYPAAPRRASLAIAHGAADPCAAHGRGADGWRAADLSQVPGAAAFGHGFAVGCADPSLPCRRTAGAFGLARARAHAMGPALAKRGHPGAWSRAIGKPGRGGEAPIADRARCERLDGRGPDPQSRADRSFGARW